MAQYRSNLVTLIKLLKKELDFRCIDEHKVQLRRTSLFTLFDVILKGNITTSDYRKSDKFIREVVLKYNQGDSSFTFGDKDFNIAPLVIKPIFGIVDGTDEIIDEELETINPSEFLEKRFAEERKQGNKHARELTTSKLCETAIEASRDQEPHDYEDTVRLLVL